MRGHYSSGLNKVLLAGQKKTVIMQEEAAGKKLSAKTITKNIVCMLKICSFLLL